LIDWYGSREGLTIGFVYEIDRNGHFKDDEGDLRNCVNGEWEDPDTDPVDSPVQSDGGSTSYYQIPEGATELNDLIEAKQMSFALGNIFKACYRFGEKDGASRIYDLNKIIYFANRLKAIEEKKTHASS